MQGYERKAIKPPTILFPTIIPTTSDVQKLQHIQQESNLLKNLLFRKRISSNSSKNFISLLKSILARVNFNGLANHRVNRLSTIVRPIKYCSQVMVSFLATFVVLLYTGF